MSSEVSDAISRMMITRALRTRGFPHVVEAEPANLDEARVWLRANAWAGYEATGRFWGFAIEEDARAFKLRYAVGVSE